MAIDISLELLQQRLKLLTQLSGGSQSQTRTGAAAGAALQSRLVQTWDTERRLIQRLLAETVHGNIRPTLDAWEQRTLSFLHKSPDRRSWTDRYGQSWDGDLVLQVIADLRERLDTWESEDDAEDAEDD